MNNIPDDLKKTVNTTDNAGSERDGALIRDAFDSIEPREGAKSRMLANILEKAAAQEKPAEKNTRKPLLSRITLITRWALPVAACLAIVVLVALKSRILPGTGTPVPTGTGGTLSPIPDTNPFKEYPSSEALRAATGLTISAPQGSEDILYASVWDNIAEVSFTIDEKQYVLRASKLSDDFSGLYGMEISSETADTENGAKLVLLRDEGIDFLKIVWAKDGVNYVLMNTDGADRDALLAIYRSLK